VPSLLTSFAILSFADLKKYKFTYWFAFPALHSDPPWLQRGPIERISPKESTALVERVGTWKYSVDNREHGFFLVKRIRISLKDTRDQPSTVALPDDELGYQWEVASLREFERGFFTGVESSDQYVSFVDPSTYLDNPGWMLRNLLVLIRHRFQLDKVQILCFRDIHHKRHEARSIILKLESPDRPLDIRQTGQPRNPQMPKVTGWERNPHGKLSARITDLALYMNPEKLADQSVDLNLKLMKWRLAPNLNLDDIKNTKCLLLGAGTLGSYVSRILQGWNVRKITFVDNATVSFSNPVRQPLFNYDDCLEGGKKKALRAAEALREIYPGVDSAGHVLTVPMLGHRMTDEAKARRDFELLQALVDEHDAIFLLMDTRESRWLPTLMGKASGKIVMNAALGFDTYVVMRHGINPPDGTEAALGCYFCNDVVVPADSIKDQTLDQQCTVTRPGIAAIASATLVELFTSIIQHPLRGLAPAPKQSTSLLSTSHAYDRDSINYPLSIIPHQIRGFLATYQNIVISGQSYDRCSACSSNVVEAYKREGWDFVKRALSEKNYVTELSGLAEVQRAAELAASDVDWDSDGNGENIDSGEVLL
jgi:ubiquitin-like modifier-activating enzyme ATG7